MIRPKKDGITLDELFKTVESRRQADPEQSYTGYLFSCGKNKIAQKVGEEAIETVIAGVSGDQKEIANESADLIYHLLVLWAEAGIQPSDVYEVLEKRRNRSGIADKKSRIRNISKKSD